MHVIISTIRRGAVNPPEPLDAENQRMVDAVIYREGLFAQMERDVPLSRWRERAMAKGRKPPQRVEPRRDY